MDQDLTSWSLNGSSRSNSSGVDSQFYKFHSQGEIDYNLNPDEFPGVVNDPVIYSVEFKVLIYILYNLVFVGALLGNLLVVIVVFFSPRMRTVTNYLIANLAIGNYPNKIQSKKSIKFQQVIC